MKEILVKPLSNDPAICNAELVLYDNGEALLRYQDDGVQSESERYIYSFTAAEFEVLKQICR